MNGYDVVTEGMMKIIWGMQEKIRIERNEFMKDFPYRNMSAVDNAVAKTKIDAQLEILDKVEEAFGSYES